MTTTSWTRRTGTVRVTGWRWRCLLFALVVLTVRCGDDRGQGPRQLTPEDLPAIVLPLEEVSAILGQVLTGVTPVW